VSQAEQTRWASGLPSASASDLKQRWQDIRGGVVVALGLFATDVGYGFIAFNPLGHGYVNAGIIAAFLASAIGSLVPALIGGSSPMFGGPRPAQTLILAALLGSLASQGAAGHEDRIIFASVLCITLAGLLQAGFGLLGLGRVIRYTPLPVLAGFTNGVALSMMLSALVIIFSAADHGGSAALGLSTVLTRTLVVASLLLFMAWMYKRLPRIHWSLVGLLAGSAFYFLAGRYLSHEALGGMLPAVTSLQPASGLGAIGFAIPAGFDWQRDLAPILAPALSLATLNSLESLVIASHQDLHDGTRHDSRRVLFGQGIANMLCGLFGGLPSAPSNSRQLVSRQLGARSQTTSIAFAVAMLAILALTPHFLWLIPKIAVAAVLLFMAYSIVDPWAKRQLATWWRKEGSPEFRAQLRGNLGVMLAVMAVAVATNLVLAMAAGVVLSMALFVRHNSRSIIGRVYPGDKRHSAVMRPLAHMELLKAQGRRIALVELSGPLFFGSGELMIEEIEALAGEATHIILDFRQVGTIDASGAGAVQRVARRLRQHGCRISLSSIAPSETRGRQIVESSAHSALPPACWFDDSDLALEAAEDELIEALSPAAGEASGSIMNLDALLGLDPQQVGTLLAYARAETYPLDTCIFRRNDPGDTLYLLRSGRVEIRVPMRKTGGYKRLIALRPGTLFGEMAILRDAARSADALVTLDGTEVLVLSRTELEKLYADHPDIALHLMRNIGIHLAARLASITDELRHALAGSPQEQA
jgi:SulP family sulfate permease